MFILDLLLFVAVLALCYGSFVAGAKYQTVAKALEALKATFKSPAP